MVQGFHQIVLQNQHCHRYPQAAYQLCITVLGQPFQHLEFVQNGAGIVIQLLSRVGGAYAASGPLQQLTVHLAFHGMNGPAQAGLGYQQFLRCRTDAAAVHHRHKIFQTSSLHPVFPFLCKTQNGYRSLPKFCLVPEH